MATSVVTTMPGIYRSGTLTSTTPIVIEIVHTNLPCTIWLNSTAAGKLIEISVDEGLLYFTPTYDPSNANQLIVTVSSPISHVRITGQANDTWGIR